jgi:hypothetical protein
MQRTVGYASKLACPPAADPQQRWIIEVFLMSIEIRDLDGGLGNLILGSGILDDEEYLETFRKLLMQDEKIFKKYRYSLCDWTQFVKVNISIDAAQKVADLCKIASSVNPDIVVGVVAKSELAFGLSRMSQMLMEPTGWDHRVFRNRRDAEEWIRAKVYEKYGIDDLTMA